MLSSIPTSSCSYHTAVKENFSQFFSILKKNQSLLLGTAGSWFILDIVFYANGLFSGQVTKTMGITSTPKQEAIASLVLQSLVYPGYLCSVFFARKVGLAYLQRIGFFLTAFFFGILAVFQPFLEKVLFLFLFLFISLPFFSLILFFSFFFSSLSLIFLSSPPFSVSVLLFSSLFFSFLLFLCILLGSSIICYLIWNYLFLSKFWSKCYHLYYSFFNLSFCGTCNLSWHFISIWEIGWFSGSFHFHVFSK
jgi:hypothetical protein